MADLADGVLGMSKFFWSLSAKKVVIPLSAGDLVNSFVIKAGIVFEGRLACWIKDFFEAIGVILAELVKLGRVARGKSTRVTADGGAKKIPYIIHAT